MDRTNEAQELLGRADLICTTGEINAAIAKLADAINKEFAGRYPVVLSVMSGAMVFAGQLLPLLSFPMESDYIHVTRYANQTTGDKLQWKVYPPEHIKGRVVLVLDDILDEGITLAAIRDKVMGMGALNIYAAVLADKAICRPKAAEADFVGLRVPDKYVFGYGMDAYGLWRNLPAIYALRD